MYDYIKGIFTYKTSGAKGSYITVETAGIGYRFEIMERDFSALPEIDEEIKIYSVLLHKEDKMSFCGFLKREERDIFNTLHIALILYLSLFANIIFIFVPLSALLALKCHFPFLVVDFLFLILLIPFLLLSYYHML